MRESPPGALEFLVVLAGALEAVRVAEDMAYKPDGYSLSHRLGSWIGSWVLELYASLPTQFIPMIASKLLWPYTH